MGPPDTARPLEGKVAIVTGGASGIGAAVVRLLSASGACVTALDLPSKASEVDELGGQCAEGSVAFAGGDVSSEADCRRAVRESGEQFDASLHVLVTAAGSERADARTTLLDGDLDEWHRLLRVNLDGTLLPALVVAERMISDGSSGSIITIASTAGRRPSAGAYSVAKAAVVMLSRVLAIELAPHAIRVNCVSPGYHDTPMLAQVAAQVHGSVDRGYDSFARRVPLGRIGTADDVANSVLFLASAQAEYMTGCTLYPDGGIANRDAGG